MTQPAASCVLCGDHTVSRYARDRERSYVQCDNCRLVFVPEAFHLNATDEKKRYDSHRNHSGDPGYRAFLARLMEPLLPLLSAGDRGLDYGSGPGPTLSTMFEEHGHPMSCYDVYYAPHRSVLDERYDFITCSETMEHFRQPAREWRRFMTMLRPGGRLGIMTRMRDGVTSFDSWYYKNDPTHVGFYSRATFQWLAGKHDLEVEFHGDSVALFQCPSTV